MFVLKQFLKVLLLPPTLWLLLLLAVLIFWRRSWARKLLLFTFLLILALHSGPVNYLLRYPLESSYQPVIDPKKAGSYDAIVVLTGGITPASGLIPFSTIDQAMFRRLDEAWRLYRFQPKPIIVSGGHVNPFTPDKNENKIARDFLINWGVPAKRRHRRSQLARYFRERRRSPKAAGSERLQALSPSHVRLSYAAQHAGFRAACARADSRAGRFFPRQVRAHAIQFFSQRIRRGQLLLHPS